jgi:hypothetical protein
MLGAQHENRFYPDISGVAKSYNYYPAPPQKPFDGIVYTALGLGKTVVDGGNTVRFCPKYPADLIQFYSVEETLNSSQREFFALQMDSPASFEYTTHDQLVNLFDLETAEKDGTLRYVGSTYSRENDIIYDGISRNGPRVVTFYPILKHRMIPLPQILELLLDMGTWGMGTPVEIEFAVNMSVPPGKPKQFGLLQMRPLVISHETEELDLNGAGDERLICQSGQVLGNGIMDDIYDIVFVDYHLFERSRSREVAEEVGYFNSKLITARRPYLLFGVGRWGSLDPWLGIPVTWEQIAGARAIVESSFKEFDVAPSQGSHFFQNITSFMIGYFTVSSKAKHSFIDWDWLTSREPVEQKKFTRLLRFQKPVVIKMNGHTSKGIIFKPEE